MKKLLVILFFMGSLVGMAQAELNNYKYIIVPKQFNDFKKENQYKTSTLIKYLFEQHGFNAVYDDALPPDLNLNRCLGLLVALADGSNMFTTKATIVLKDCNSKEVFSTEEGVSKIKEYESAYADAIRKAFNSFDGVNYAYSPANGSNVSTLPIQSGGGTVAISQTTVTRNANGTGNAPAASVQQQATREVQSYKDLAPVPADVKKSTGVLYAQEITNGFQLVDSTPKVVLKIFKSSVPDVYTGVGDDKNGMVYNRNGKWYFEYYEGGDRVTEELNIKF